MWEFNYIIFTFYVISLSPLKRLFSSLISLRNNLHEIILFIWSVQFGESCQFWAPVKPSQQPHCLPRSSLMFLCSWSLLLTLAPGNHSSALCHYRLICILYKLNHWVCILVFTFYFSLSITFLQVAHGISDSFLSTAKFLFTLHMQHLVYLFTCWWTFVLVPPFGDWK